MRYGREMGEGAFCAGQDETCNSIISSRFPREEQTQLRTSKCFAPSVTLGRETRLLSSILAKVIVLALGVDLSSALMAAQRQAPVLQWIGDHVWNPKRRKPGSILPRICHRRTAAKCEILGTSCVSVGDGVDPEKG